MAYYSNACVRANGTKWRGQLQYKDEAGKWRKRTKTLAAKGKRAALKELEEWREAMEAEHAAEVRAEALGTREGETVAEYVARYIEAKAKDDSIDRSTANGYRGMLDRQIAPYGEIGGAELAALTPAAVSAWVGELSERYAPVTVRKSFNLLRAAMREAVDRDIIAKDPTRTVKPPKNPKANPNALDDAGITALNAVLDSVEPSPALLGIRMALYTGMREGELCALRWGRVDLDAKTITVSEALGRDGAEYYAKQPKTGGQRPNGADIPDTCRRARKAPRRGHGGVPRGWGTVLKRSIRAGGPAGRMDAPPTAKQEMARVGGRFGDKGDKGHASDIP